MNPTVPNSLERNSGEN